MTRLVRRRIRGFPTGDLSCSNPRGSSFNGSLDEFRLWNVARTGSQITEAMNRGLVGNEAGIVGYWKLAGVESVDRADSVSVTTIDVAIG